MISTKLQLYKHKTLADGTHPVVIQIIRNGKRKIISLKYTSTRSDWDFRRERFKKTIGEHWENWNMQLDRYELKAKRIVDDLILSGEPVTVERVKKLLFQENTDTCFVDFVTELIERMKKGNEIGNAWVYRNMRNSIKRFGRKSIHFSDIDSKFLSKYKSWLQSKGLANSTVHLYLRTLRAAFNKAIQEGEVSLQLYPFKNQFNPNGFSLSGIRIEPNHRALSEEELKVLAEMDITKYPHLKDTYYMYWFMFHCRGLNWTDLCLLQRGNFRAGRITYTRKKTGKAYSIKVTPQIRKILDQFDSSTNYIFPVLSQRHKTEAQKKNRIKRISKKVNNDLKEIAIITGIDPDQFTTYSARHSYAMCLRRGGVGTEIISQALGHSDLSTTKHYLESFENDVIDKADEILSYF